MTNRNSEIGSADIELSAPVHLPDREHLAIFLVPQDYIYRLEEYRSDEKKWESVFWVFTGAALGLVINWATGDITSLTASSVILLVVLVTVAVFTLFASRDYKRRADKTMIDMSTRFSVSGLTQNSPATALLVPPVHDNKSDKIQVRIVSPTHTVNARLPSDVPISQLLPALALKLDLPGGQLYSLSNGTTGRKLDANELLSEGVSDGDTLYLTYVAGEAPLDVAARIRTLDSNPINVTLPNVKVAQILPSLVTRLQLSPSTAYTLWNLRTKTPLDPGAPLLVGLVEGDTLLIHDSASIPVPFQTVNSDEEIHQPDPG